MRRPPRLRPRSLCSVFPLSALFSLWALASVGCTPTMSQAPALSVAQRPAQAAPPLAQMTRLSSGALHFSLNYPRFASHQQRFQAQGLYYPDFERFQVSVIGIGLDTPLSPVSANPAQNNTVPALCDATRCNTQVRFENVPAGENRVALITAYNSAGEAIPGSTLAAAFTLPTDPEATLTVRLSYLSTPVGQVVQGLLAQGEHLLVSQLDTEALQDFVSALTGVSGDYPEFSYIVSPARVDISQLVQDIKTYQGDIAALSLASPPSPTNTDYLQQGATLTGSIAGLVGDDKVKLRLTDPTSTPIFVGNGPFSFDHVPVGDWQLVLENTQGYTVTNAPGSVTLEDHQTLSLPETTLTSVPNASPVLVNTVIQQGGNIILQGRNFNPNAASNTIVITGNLNSGGFIAGYWSVNATEITEEDGFYSVAFPLPPEITGQWFNLRISDPNEPISFEVSDFNMLGLDRGAAVVGERLLLNAGFFDPLASNQEVVIAGRTIPTANLTVLNNTQMQVQLPPDLPAGETVVEVTSLGLPSTYAPPLTLLSQPKVWTTDWRAVAGTATEHVLTVASSALLPKRVWFGSKAEGASSGGVWVCDFGDTLDAVSCANPQPGSNVGSIQAFAQAPYNTYRVYAGSETQGVLICPEHCAAEESWAQSNTGLGNLNIRDIVVDPHEPKHIYVATAAGVYRSLNAGASWSAYNNGLLLNQQDAHSLALYRPHILAEPVLYLGTAGAGVLRKTGAAHWQSVNTGIFSQDATSNEGTPYLESVTISTLEAHPVTSGLIYGGGTGQHQILDAIWKVGIWERSETEGLSNWIQRGRNGSNGFPCPENSPDLCTPVTAGTGLSSMQVRDLAVDPAQPQHIYAATGSDGAQAGGIYRSTDAGASWQPFHSVNSEAALTDATALVINHLKLYAGTSQGLFYTP